MPTQARAVRIAQFGGPEVLSLGSIELRDPGPHEVLVEVAAAGLNRADCLQRRGLYPAPPGVAADVPGLEFAGVVARLGSDVHAVAVGERVMAICAGAGMATHVIAHERELLRVPEGLDLAHAAAIPEAFMTAYDALFRQARLGMGQHLLVHAVGSGVGTAALQLALCVGAIPVGTSRSAAKLEAVEQLGLLHGILTSEPRFADRVAEITGGRLADVVLDTVGASYLGENVRAAAAGGVIVTIGLLGGVKGELPLGLLVSKRLTLRGSVLRSRALEEKAALAQAFSAAVLPQFLRGALRPVVANILPMSDVVAAHRAMESDSLVGKLVLVW